jgi:hypothetical protein
MSDRNFYLGRLYDPVRKQINDQALTYDPADLTTHAFVTGMTGSGKTGLCIGLLEEAALQGIPALVIDPKGDLTNLLLHFPDLAPQDFQPWIDPETARREGQTLEQAATQTALQWRKGLEEWGISQERLAALKNAVQFAVYTPGSDAGLPVSVLTSLAAPEIPWEGNREVLRERINSTVTALLGMVGLTELDPLRSREHILLANIFEGAWSQGKDLELTELILQTQSPPFEKLGAFPVDSFFPPKDRSELAMQLNNILAAPAFEIWREGQPLDIHSLLFMPDGRPRHSVFYLAHLSDSERMFFVTLLLSAVETWMRTQSGATTLRAILYMDEIFGYLPPISNPPSKGPMLRMLKQARAFGLGLLLATQNPVDMDYKALSNAGTWFIGKLQTERDKGRLLDGLESAAGSVDRQALEQVISGLGKRAFLLHNVHAKAPVLFQTRWAMNYLAGPLTRTQIPALNRLVGADQSTGVAQADSTVSVTASQPGPPPESNSHQPAPSEKAEPVFVDQSISAMSKVTEGSQVKPPVPSGVGEYFLPMNYGLTEAINAADGPVSKDARVSGVLYRPALLASAQIRFLDRKYGVDSQVQKSRLVLDPDKRGAVRWEDYPYHGPSLEKLETQPATQARFVMLDAPLNESKSLTALERDFTDWVFRSVTVSAKANQALKVYAGPDVSLAEFMKACADTARELRDAEMAKVTEQFERKIATLENRLTREGRELKQDEEEYNQRKMEEWGTHAENFLLGKGRISRKVSTSLTKHRLTQQAKADIEESEESIQDYEQQMAELENEHKQSLAEINDRWGDLVNDISEVTITPKKQDIYVHLFGVTWVPYYLVESDGQVQELPAFGAES